MRQRNVVASCAALVVVVTVLAAGPSLRIGRRPGDRAVENPVAEAGHADSSARSTKESPRDLTDVSLLTVGDGDDRTMDPGESHLASELQVPRIPDEQEPEETEPSSAERPPAPATQPSPPEEEVEPVSDLASAPEPEESQQSPSTNDNDPLVPPVLLKAAWLPYPEGALKRRAEAHVDVRILVGEDGRVKSVELAGSPPDPVLGAAALDSARDMIFRPGSRGGRPVEVWFSYRFDFSLPKKNG